MRELEVWEWNGELQQFVEVDNETLVDPLYLDMDYEPGVCLAWAEAGRTFPAKEQPAQRLQETEELLGKDRGYRS